MIPLQAQLYSINLGERPAINFAPATQREEIIQNVRTIISTIKWQIPLARDIGISGDVIDLPTLQAKARLTQEIIQALKMYEPRVKIERIDFEADITGRLIPKIEVRINAN